MTTLNILDCVSNGISVTSSINKKPLEAFSKALDGSGIEYIKAQWYPPRFELDKDFPTFLDWHSSGELDLESMVTARYALEDINRARQALENGEIQGRAIMEF